MHNSASVFSSDGLLTSQLACCLLCPNLAALFRLCVLQGLRIGWRGLNIGEGGGYYKWLFFGVCLLLLQGYSLPKKFIATQGKEL